jgi:gluconolactonase
MRFFVPFVSLLVLFCLNGCKTSQENLIPVVFKAQKQDEFIDPKAKLELVWGKSKFTEGPAIGADGSVYFTDIPAELIMKDSRGKRKGVQVFRQGTGRANGLAFNQKGEMIICEGGSRRLSKLTMDGQYEVLTDNYRGLKFNSPNDLAIGKNGDIYFTDPRYGNRDNMELDYEGVYLLREGKTILATKKVDRPNGILISQDGKFVYVADNNPEGIRALYKFEVQGNGKLSNRQVLHVFQANERGIDGMDMDVEGNLYATAGKGDQSGVYIFSPEGENLAILELPDKPTNCRFGGTKEPNTLYITCQVERQPHENKAFGLYKIQMKKKGYRLFP